MTNHAFQRYIGIDYSGAETPDASLKGLRVYEARRESMPVEVEPPPSPRKYWTRRGLAKWLAEQLSGDVPTIVGIDQGFSFPLRYFEVHHLEPDWPIFLDDFQKHWPTDAEHTYVDFIRHGSRGEGKARSGSARRRRITEERAGTQSVFHFAAPGSVAKSTHAGLPWLGYLRNQLGDRVPSGPSTAGKSLRADPRWWRFTHRCGVRAIQGRAVHPTSTTLMRSPPGCVRWTWTAASAHFSSPICCPANAMSPKSRVGFWG